LASIDFSALVAAIRQTHEYMTAQAGRAVNISLTLRNWLIGAYIGLLGNQTESHAVEKVGTASPQLRISPDQLIHRLSYSHFELIVDIHDGLKRIFYEIECIRGNWSVRELKRQIGSLYYERSGLSRDKDKLAGLTQGGADQAEPKLAIRDPYIFEFLGIKPREVMHESDLEEALLDNLHDIEPIASFMKYIV
ncbi:unnamed protein product, partial [marine sediment metagenome]